MDDGNDLASLGIHIDHNFFNQGAHNSFLQSSIAVEVFPHRLKLAGQVLELFPCRRRDILSLRFLLDPQFDFLDLFAAPGSTDVPIRPLPDGFPDQPVRTVWKRGVLHILRCLQISVQRFQDFDPAADPHAVLAFSTAASCSRFHHAQYLLSDGLIQPRGRRTKCTACPRCPADLDLHPYLSTNGPFPV